MEESLKALLVSADVQCSDAQLAAFSNAEIKDIGTLRALSDADFKELGIAIGRRIQIRKAVEGGRGYSPAGMQQRTTPTQASMLQYATSPAIVAAARAGASAALSNASSSSRAAQHGQMSGRK